MMVMTHVDFVIFNAHVFGQPLLVFRVGLVSQSEFALQMRQLLLGEP